MSNCCLTTFIVRDHLIFLVLRLAPSDRCLEVGNWVMGRDRKCLRVKMFQLTLNSLQFIRRVPVRLSHHLDLKLRLIFR